MNKSRVAFGRRVEVRSHSIDRSTPTIVCDVYLSMQVKKSMELLVVLDTGVAENVNEIGGRDRAAC